MVALSLDLSLCLIQPEHGEQATDHDGNKYCPAFHVGIIAALDAIDGFLERHDKSVVGGFTIVLAISTIGLWLATNKLWAAGEKQFSFTQQSIDLARDEFIASHRPVIVVRAVHFNTVMTPNHTIKMRFIATNTGDTEATILTVGAKIVKGQKHVPEIPGEFPALNTKVIILKSGEFSEWTFETDFVVTPGDFSAIQVKSLIIFCVGFVQYRDSLGAGHLTGFGRQYDTERGGFFAIDHPTYEYSY